MYYTTRKKKEAQAQYIKAVNTPGDIPTTVWVQLYILDVELEDYDSLLKHTQLGIEKLPKTHLVIFTMPFTQQQKKNNSAAADILLKSFSISKDDSDKSILYAPQLKLQMLITLGDVSYELKTMHALDSSYEAALEIDPNNANCFKQLCFYLLKEMKS